MSQNPGKDITNIETDQQLRKVVTKIAMGEQVSDDGGRTHHERFRAERVARSKNWSKEILKGIVMSLLLDQ